MLDVDGCREWDLFFDGQTDTQTDTQTHRQRTCGLFIIDLQIESSILCSILVTFMLTILMLIILMFFILIFITLMLINLKEEVRQSNVGTVWPCLWVLAWIKSLFSCRNVD